MINEKKIVVVLPAYNAGRTLEKTYYEIPSDIVDGIVLCDDASKDNTLEVAEKLEIQYIIKHSENRGYGANQKTCYNKAIELGADIVVLLHPDYQYTPRLISSMVYLIANDLYKVVLGSRILGRGALKGGMPLHRYLGNRTLTFLQNLVMGTKLSEFHTGFRAYSVDLLKKIDFEKNSDGFLFDNQILAQIICNHHEIAEITCPTNYNTDSSSIDIRDGVVYFTGVLWVTFRYILHKFRLLKYPLLEGM